MPYLLPPDARSLQPGEDTGIALNLNSYVYPGSHGAYMQPFALIVPGPDRLEAGSYKVVAQGGSSPAVATFLVRMGMVPGLDADGFDSPGGGGTITTPDGTFLAPGIYDVIAAA